MNFTQNAKINQVTDKTLVIGMDIAKRTHYACMVDERGLLLKKSFPVYQSRQGFEFFYEAHLTNWFSLGADYQYISSGIEKAMGIENSGVSFLGFRSMIRF